MDSTEADPQPPISIEQWIDSGGLIVIHKSDEEGSKYGAYSYRSETAIEDGLFECAGWADTWLEAVRNLLSALSNRPQAGDESLLLSVLDTTFCCRVSEEKISDELLPCARDLFGKLADVVRELQVFARGATQVDKHKRDQLVIECLTGAELLRDVQNRLSDQEELNAHDD